MIKEFTFNDMSLEEFANMFEEFQKYYKEKHKDQIEKRKKEDEERRRKLILEDLDRALAENIQNCKELMFVINKYGFENEPCVINWCDTLNEISIKH